MREEDKKGPQTNPFPQSVWSHYRGWQPHPTVVEQIRCLSRKKTLIFGMWNVRRLPDRTGTMWSQGRIEVAASVVMPIRCAQRNPIRRWGFFEGRGKRIHILPEEATTNRRSTGVGFTIRTASVKYISVLPVRINECLMKLHILFSKSRHLTIIRVYLPTFTYSNDTKEQL